MAVLNFTDELLTGLAELRVIAETRMRGRLLAQRPVPGQEDVLEDGTVVPLFDHEFEHETPFYCRYPGLAHETVRHSAGTSIVESRLVVRVPFGRVYRPGDVLTILEDPDNPQIEGVVVRVASIDDQSQATAQRLLTEDFQSGVVSS